MRIAKIMGLGLALGLAGNVAAAPIIGGQIIVANTGNVSATFMAGYASWTDELILYLPANGLGIILNNQTTPYGTVFNLGDYTAGTELVFKIEVKIPPTNTLKHTWYSGDGSLNSDGMAHAAVINEWTPGQTMIGFEDMLGGGDGDFDDLAFTLSNVSGHAAVPEPGTFALMGLGLLGIGAVARRRRS